MILTPSPVVTFNTPMAKLYFRYGTVSSAKSMNLLAVVHNYEQQEKKALLLKPKLDVRFGEKKVRSRAGLERQADCLIDENSHLDFLKKNFDQISCLVVDEAQFLSPQFVEVLRDITIDQNIPVICYGLRTDFQTRLFAGSQRLLELADAIEEIKTICYHCNQKAVFNMRLVNGTATLAGEQVELGGDEKYQPVCYSHYRALTQSPSAHFVNASQFEAKEVSPI